MTTNEEGNARETLEAHLEKLLGDAAANSAQVAMVLQLDRHMIEVRTKIEELERLMWRNRNGKPGVVATLDRIDETLVSVRAYLRYLLMVGSLGVFGILATLVAERMAS